MTDKKISTMATVLATLCLLELAACSVLVPTYVLPPASFAARDQRSLPAGQGLRTLARLAGGHLKHNYTGKNAIGDPGKNHIDHAKKTSIEKDIANYDTKFAGVVVKVENRNVGWNQGQWDDGMLMSSAGNGKEKGKQKGGDDDEDKKTLADQVAEGKYGLIQKELFSKTPKRPGVISYAPNPETKTRDNEASLGGLKNDEIWLAEDHLLVLKGGSYPDHGPRPGETAETWPPIDAYQAPPRQVKIPQNPEVPPPFPVRLSDDGPLVFLTPNGSVPAPLFPARPPGADFNPFPPPPFPYPPPSPATSQGPHQGNITPGGTPFPIPPFPFLPPGNESEPPFPFPGPINASFPGGLPPGASFLPPPGNLTDLYDEDDPSIYYPPPYSFSYQADNTSHVPAGPLVPGIVLPPPPDFFAPLDAITESPAPITTVKPSTVPPTSPPTIVIKPQKTKLYLPPATKPKVITDNEVNVIESITTQPPKIVSVRPTQKHPAKVVIITKPVPTRITQTLSPAKPASTARPIKIIENSPVTVIQKQVKTTLKPVTNSIASVFYPEKSYYDENAVSQSPRPFLIYGPPDRSQLHPYPDKTYVTSTPVPLRAYYSNPEYETGPKIQLYKQNIPTVTRVRPDFLQSTRQNGKSVASFYFYEEPVSKVQTTTPDPVDYYDGRNYYPAIKNNAQLLQDDMIYNQQLENGYANPNNLEFKPLPSREPSPFFFIPQRQGSRTLTQEYFSIQKPKQQNNFGQSVLVPQSRPETFYEQIAAIQQTIDYYTTHRPKINLYPHGSLRDVRQKVPKSQPRPAYQFSFNNNVRPEQNTFKAPEMDSEPFRPMVTYSKPYNVVSEYQTTPGTSFENQASTESPAQRYYATVRPDGYEDEDRKSPQSKPPDAPKSNYVTLSPKLKKARTSGATTKNPINHAYYTKQEEGYFDDMTKNYFNIFGQKIEHGNGDGVYSTTPIRPIEVTTSSTPTEVRSEVSIAEQQQQQPIVSLASDTRVNYRQPRPLVNPESEFIPIVDPVVQAKYEAERQQLKQRLPIQPYKPKVHNVEIVKSEGYEQEDKGSQSVDVLHPVPGTRYAQQQQIQQFTAGRFGKDFARGRPVAGEGRPGSLVAYRLPGEGAHVYFLTPQPARPEFKSTGEIASLS